MNSPLSWPEPASVIMMVMFSFLGGAAVYRANVHIAVEALLNAVSPAVRRAMLWGVDAVHGGDRAVHARLRHPAVPRHAVPTMAEFPWLSQGDRLSADPGRRPADAAVPDRARLGRRSAARRRSCTATRPRSSSSHGRPRPARLVRAAVRARRAGRLRARAWRRSIAAMWVDIPLEAVMLKISDGTDDFALLAIPFFVLAGAHHGRGRHGGAPDQPRQGVRRLHPRRPRAGEHPRQHAVRLHLGLVGRRHRVDRLGDDPADGQGRLSARVRHQRHDLRLGAGAADPAVAQRGDLLARRRRHDLGRAPVPRRHLSRACCSACA